MIDTQTNIRVGSCGVTYGADNSERMLHIASYLAGRRRARHGEEGGTDEGGVRPKLPEPASNWLLVVSPHANALSPPAVQEEVNPTIPDSFK